MTAGEGENRMRSTSEMGAEARKRWLAQLRAASGAAGGEPAECYGCGCVYPRRELTGIEEIPGYRWPRYCPACAEDIRAAHRRRCALCGVVYVATTPGGRRESGGLGAGATAMVSGLCPECRSGERLREWARVRYHLLRARLLGLPATLTLGQWLRTIEHFAGGCAYCGAQPFSDLDHFLPLAAGGGTTAANCVPACAGCNNLKRALDPGQPLWARLPRAAVERVGEYLNDIPPNIRAT